MPPLLCELFFSPSAPSVLNLRAKRRKSLLSNFPLPAIEIFRRIGHVTLAKLGKWTLQRTARKIEV
jgi:hypothetical protein